MKQIVTVLGGLMVCGAVISNGAGDAGPAKNKPTWKISGDLEEAFAIANNVSYGLTAGIVTNDLRKAIRFAERAEAGMVKVNQGTVGASIQAPFGGFKHSGSGMFREMGKGAVEFFTKIKTVYLDGQ